jgi:LPXTG-motif cell wall-anchored protein
MALGLGFSAISTPAASAVPTNAVTFGCFNNPGAGCPAARFNGYATGSELHLSGLTAGTTTLANLDQGFSGASTASAGLTKVINSETTSVVQPAQAAGTKAYGTGAGLEIGLGTDSLPTTDQNQIKVAGRAEQIAPPNGPAVTSDISIPGDPLIRASVLKGEGAAVYDGQVCPLGQPISYGLGHAADAQVLIVNGTQVINTAGPGTATAQSTSETYLSPNGDGSFGLSTTASDIIAPLTVNVPGALQVVASVQSAGGPSDPVTLTAKTTGESTGAKLAFSSDDILKVDLVTPAGTTNIITIPLSSIGQGGLHIPLSTSNSTLLTQLSGAASGLASTIPAIGPAISGVLTQPQVTSLLTQLGTTVSQVTQQVATINLGSIDVDTYPHVIGQAATDPAVPVGGTSAAGALDLLHLNLAVSGTVGTQALPTISLANFFAGHLETAANLTSPIVCSIPVIKSANPTAVTAGNTFVYNIQVPDPAKLDLIDCNLSNVTVTDTITDAQGTPSFTVTSAKDVATGAPGTIQTISPNKAIVTWTGLSYTVAPTGQPPNAPIPLTIAVSVPATSTSGVIEDTVVANATVSGCQGGAATTTDTSATAANGAALTGMFTLQQPSVAAAATTPAGSSPASKSLPLTGAMGGLWQPLGGLGALAGGGGALYLVRRSRRLGPR